MSDRLRFILALNDADRTLLDAVTARLNCNRSEALRWALRWYALGGPWRGPGEPLLPPLEGQVHGLVVGPDERGGG